jgi:hypothetical protein
MKNELDIVRDLSEKFERLGIPFMLTGSMALNYYAQPRMTRDIDVVIEVRPMDVPRLVAAFERDYYVARAAVLRAVEEGSIFNVIHEESVIKVDCIVKKDVEYRNVEFERRRQVAIADFRTFIVSKEDLTLSKLIWAKDSRSELQLGDVRNLLATGCDRDYLEHWALKLGVGDLLEECLHG